MTNFDTRPNRWQAARDLSLAKERLARHQRIEKKSVKTWSYTVGQASRHLPYLIMAVGFLKYGLKYGWFEQAIEIAKLLGSIRIVLS